MRVWSAPRVLHPPRGKHSPSTFRGTFCAAKLKACDFAVFAHPLSPKNAFRASLPSKSESRRCGNHVFVRDFFQRLQVEDVELKLSSETSLKNCKLKIWKRSFRARPLSKTEGSFCARLPFKTQSSRSENEGQLLQRPSLHWPSLQWQSLLWPSLQWLSKLRITEIQTSKLPLISCVVTSCSHCDQVRH